MRNSTHILFSTSVHPIKHPHAIFLKFTEKKLKIDFRIEDFGKIGTVPRYSEAPLVSGFQLWDGARSVVRQPTSGRTVLSQTRGSLRPLGYLAVASGYEKQLVGRKLKLVSLESHYLKFDDFSYFSKDWGGTTFCLLGMHVLENR